MDILEVYADGSVLIGSPLILSHVDENTRVRVEIFVSGVTFEDGTTEKWLTADDFDQYNRYYLTFIKASDVSTSYCHRIHLYDGDTYLGTQ